jgi:hypothetical protein
VFTGSGTVAMRPIAHLTLGDNGVSGSARSSDHCENDGCVMFVASDLLARVERGDLTVDQARMELEAYLDAVHRGEADPDWPRALGLSQAEATAYLHGADLSLMLDLRRAGPTITCARCGAMINVRDAEWTVDLGPARPVLVHIECPIARAKAN